MTRITTLPGSYGTTIDGLRNTMRRHELTQRDVSELCCVSVKTVESWLADPKSANHRKMPPRHLLSLAHQLPGFLVKRKTAAKAAKKEMK